MLNITMRKIGGIRFISIGRLSISFSVSSRDAYLAKLEAKCERVAMQALEVELA